MRLRLAGIADGFFCRWAWYTLIPRPDDSWHIQYPASTGLSLTFARWVAILARGLRELACGFFHVFAGFLAGATEFHRFGRFTLYACQAMAEESLLTFRFGPDSG